MTRLIDNTCHTAGDEVHITNQEDFEEGDLFRLVNIILEKLPFAEEYLLFLHRWGIYSHQRALF